jgi:hypothetical protein
MSILNNDKLILFRNNETKGEKVPNSYARSSIEEVQQTFGL